jgi:large subunit ribosomal protein L7/L12
MEKLKEIAQKMSQLTPQEASELSEILENDYNVKLPYTEVVMNVPITKVVEEKQTQFDVILEEITMASKLNLVKFIKNYLNIGLRESKELIESAPVTIAEKVDEYKAEETKNELEALGAKVTIK